MAAHRRRAVRKLKTGLGELRDRGFASELRFDRSAPALLLSPTRTTP